MSSVSILLLSILIAIAYYYYFVNIKSLNGTTTTAPTTTASGTTTTTATPTTMAPGTQLGPITDNSTWQNFRYDFRVTPHITVPTQGTTLNNQNFVLSQGYRAYVQNDMNGTISYCDQGNTGNGHTLIVYKNNQYWYVADTDLDFGPNLTISFSNIQLGRVLFSLQRNSNNLALINQNVSPTAPYTTLVSGTYTVDAAMLNIAPDRTTSNVTSWFYGGNTFPYAYTVTSFMPSSA